MDETVVTDLLYPRGAYKTYDITTCAVFVDCQHCCIKRGGTHVQYSQQLLLWDEVMIRIISFAKGTAEMSIVGRDDRVGCHVATACPSQVLPAIFLHWRGPGCLYGTLPIQTMKGQ